MRSFRIEYIWSGSMEIPEQKKTEKKKKKKKKKREQGEHSSFYEKT